VEKKKKGPNFNNVSISKAQTQALTHPQTPRKTQMGVQRWKQQKKKKLGCIL